MDGDVSRVRTERIYTLPTAGRQGRRSHEEQQERFRLDGEGADDEQRDDAESSQPNEHGSVGRPDDDEAGRNLDITG